VSACQACRADVPVDARFCPACGARLEAAGAMATERKVVTTLFADLVGFTALGERHDPEDIDTALRGFYGLARTIVERFGGTVEKYIGDAVVGLFGVPAAHEDDAERAVRAALELVAHLHELPPVGEEKLQVRCAVNTGPALVRLDALPGTGEGALVGDAVNTAARLLEAAAPMSVVVGERTYALTDRLIAYRRLGELSVRGKQHRVQTWVAVGHVARRGVDLSQTYGAPLVGREVELGVLKGMLARVQASCAPQLALVTGEAGVGKTRLAFELAQWIDREPGLMVVWRQASCLPFGEGSGFQPLADIVRAHAGITEWDDEGEATTKLDHVVPKGPDHEWMAQRLRALIGLDARPADQTENFAAWARFIDALGAGRPAVVFLDDLHWAEDAMLDFLSRLIDSGCSAPLLLLGAARPELIEQHPEFARHLGAAPGAEAPMIRLDLGSLTPGETERLVAKLSPDAGAEMKTVLADRSGGNPFYTEELVRLFQHDHKGATVEWLRFDSLPATLQALLTARLDALDRDRKATLADAAVAGQEFTVELLAAIGGRNTDDVRRLLGELAAKEFIRPADDEGSGVEGASVRERFSFWHALTRDAAYSQLSRKTRADKHAAAARWLEQQSRSGSSESIETAAHHYLTAIGLFRDMHDETSAALIRPRTAASLACAGDRVMRVDVEGAGRFYSKALELMDTASAERLAVQMKLAPLLGDEGRFAEAQSMLEQAVDDARIMEDRLQTAVAMSQLARMLLRRADPSATDVATAAAELLTDDDACREAITVLEQLAMLRIQSADLDAVTDLTLKIETMCGIVGIPMPHMALGLRGYARFGAGRRREGIQDQLDSVLAAEKRGQMTDASRLLDAAALLVMVEDGAAASAALRREGIDAARARHDEAAALYVSTGLVEALMVLGRWPEALDLGVHLAREDNKRGLVYQQSQDEYFLALLHVLRGELHEARPHLMWIEGHREKMPGVEVTGILAAAMFQISAGSVDEAVSQLRRLQQVRTPFFGEPTALLWWPAVVRAAIAAGSADVARALAPRALDWSWCLPEVRTGLTALLAEADGDQRTAGERHRGAALGWQKWGFPYEEAMSWLHAGGCFIRSGRRDEASASLLKARRILEDLGARPGLAEVDRLLSQQVSGSAARPASGPSGGRR
jgi:class 3 adenylate cyclase/tetratricopeptide (TPR) repeat protein